MAGTSSTKIYVVVAAHSTYDLSAAQITLHFDRRSADEHARNNGLQVLVYQRHDDVTTSSDIADDDNADDEPEAEPEIKKTKTAKKAKAAKGEGAAKKVSKRAAVPEGEPQSLVGHTCTLAGHLHHMDHKTFVQTVEIYGGTYTSKLADANFLVVGANPGKKAQEAADLGLNTITEETFFEAIGADYPEPPAKKAKKAGKAEKAEK